ncbi:hypothetical protein P692DRAFT_20385790 [Suillus brevipes Sb2]|nr:hypothetical protein P692DRAFT_20385790 [Suillus brevipes Sb2]
MSRASITSNRSRTLLQVGNTDSALDRDQSARLDDRAPLQNDTLPPAEDGEENSGPSMMQLPMSSGISNSVPPQPPEPRVQASTSNNSPEGALDA